MQRPAAHSRVGGWWPAVVVLVVVSTAMRTWAARAVPVPWIAPDEMIYGLLGRSLYSTGSLSIFGGPTPFYSALVPGFVGLPLSVGDLAFGYGLLKPVQALAMSLTAIPVYVWGRSLVGRPWAFAAAALTLAAPALVYSGMVMSEVLFYPVFLLSAWAMARAIEKPTWQRQGLFVVAVVAAAATRLQAVVLVPAFVTAVGLDVLLARSLARARRFVPMIVGLGLLGAAWVGWRVASGEAVLGTYGVVTHATYGFGRAARFVIYHAGSLILLTGVVPACALLLLLGAAARGRDADPRVRAFLVVTCSLSVWLVVEVGVFASEYVGRLAERDLIGLAPLYFLGFAVWLGRGAPRGYWPASIACVLVAVPLVVLPLGKLVTAEALPDAPSLVPLYNLRTASSLSTLELVFYGCAGAALVLFALLPRRALILLVLLLLAALMGGSVAASRYAADQGRLREQRFLAPTPTWIDRAARGPVAYLYEPGGDWTGVWELAFWNRRIDRVYDLASARLAGPIRQQHVRFRRDGRLVTRRGLPVSAPYVVTGTGVVGSEPSFEFAGEQLASSVQPGSQEGGLALWRIDEPIRLSFRTTGLRPNGDIYPGENAGIFAYGCTRRRAFRVTLLIKQPETVTILRNGKVYERLRFRSPAPNQPWSGAIPTQPGTAPRMSVCTLEVQTDGLLGSTVFRADP